MSRRGTPDIALIVLAKEPRAGRCKTRLCPPLAPAEAALVAAAALADTLAAVSDARVARRVLALDGEPGEWLPPGFEVVEQARGGLAERLAGAFVAVGGPALLIGMDTPQLTGAAIDAAVTELRREGIDAVLGPASDGGYWAIGLREPRSEVFRDVPMSSDQTAARQRARLDRLGLRFTELETMRDFDTIDDARAVAAICPRSGFARQLRLLPCAAIA